MASGGHILAQQKPNVEARIKVLINDDLKRICKAYGVAVSGTKVVLQKRCITGEWTTEDDKTRPPRAGVGAERSGVWGSRG